eukprot:1154028-Pelagomonas_calceolata.AAC.9
MLNSVPASPCMPYLLHDMVCKCVLASAPGHSFIQERKKPNFVPASPCVPCLLHDIMRKCVLASAPGHSFIKERRS